MVLFLISTYQIPRRRHFPKVCQELSTNNQDLLFDLIKFIEIEIQEIRNKKTRLLYFSDQL